jgi:hypothetical protein
MRVRCIKNKVAAIKDREVRERLLRAIHLDVINDLAIGRGYVVQALEEGDGGLWLYLHTVQAADFPYPYPAELFEFQDDTLPVGWCVSLKTQGGNVVFKRMTFC